MAELCFKRIELTDKPKIDEFLARSNFRGCEYTFGNNFVWRNIYNVEICFTEDFYFCKQGMGGQTRFIYPAGSGGLKKAVELIAQYARENDLPQVMIANKDVTQQLCEAFPEANAKLNRDYCDYVYLAEELENLKGKKYHGKRNHLNRFYENDWSFEPITAQNLAECAEMNKRWRAENVDKCELTADAESKLDELCIADCSLKH